MSNVAVGLQFLPAKALFKNLDEWNRLEHATVIPAADVCLFIQKKMSHVITCTYEESWTCRM